MGALRSVVTRMALRRSDDDANPDGLLLPGGALARDLHVALPVGQLDAVLAMDRAGDVSDLRRRSLSRAWSIKLVAGEWDNESNENVIEQMTLTYDFFELVQ